MLINNREKKIKHQRKRKIFDIIYVNYDDYDFKCGCRDITEFVGCTDYQIHTYILLSMFLAQATEY